MPKSVSPDYQYCPRCAKPLTPTTRGGLPRPTCTSCGFVHFRNPAVGVAVVLLDDAGRILLGRRSAGGNLGQWCIPCGYVEWGEDIRAAARREFLEETGIDVAIGEVCAVHSNFHNPTSLTVGVWFYAEQTGGKLRASDDLDHVAWFPPDAPPEPLAFPTDRLVLADLSRISAKRR
ncbi:MAG: NUDIX domain-containing protein [Chloroflexi bacterium]|nr:NUDIX domain-containing protein [Chloroflexota bacterium]MYD48620.1 NUDIX domain-containing protein [Chloroflexota bacterium]